MPKPFFSHKAIYILTSITLPIACLGYYFKATYDSNILYSLGIGLGMFWFATVLYWLKKSDQFWYGALEILFGSVSLFYSVLLYSREHPWDETTLDEFLKRAALIYLIVRGIGNMDDGIKKDFCLQEKIKPIWHKLINFLMYY